MKIGRIGSLGSERPVVVENDVAYFVDSVIPDWNRETLQDGGFKKVKASPWKSFPSISVNSERLGSPVARPTKLICVGLNYIKHIAETNAQTPTEPIILMKAPDTLVGPNDDVVIPPHSTATDYEVELALVIGKRALYLDKSEKIEDYILGYSIWQDISERHWQLERGGQWVKGKSFPTFTPMGPCIVTPDEIETRNLRLWCSIDGEKRQDSSTSDLLFGIDHLVWYISQFMELFPGDIISTGTPGGVGMGYSPTRYLRAGQIIETGIESIGEMRNRVIQFG